MRDPTTRKLIRSPAGDPCCCGSGCDTCDVCTADIAGLTCNLTLHLPTYDPDAHYDSGGCSFGPWTVASDGSGCYHTGCDAFGYYSDDGGWKVETQGDTSLFLTLQRADTLGYTDADLVTSGFGAVHGVESAQCVYLLYQSPGTSVVVRPYLVSPGCTDSEESPIGDPLDLVVYAIRRVPDNNTDYPCCGQWELWAHLGVGNPLVSGGGAIVFRLFVGFSSALDGACTLPASITCDPATVTECAIEIDKGEVGWACYLKQNVTLDEDGNCFDNFGSSCGSATLNGS